MATGKESGRKMVFIGMLGGISAVLMLFQISVPLAPGFLKFDISELPALFAGFFMGPAAGAAVVLVKVLLKLAAQGTETAFVGELMNLFGSLCFILPAAWLYKRNHTKKGALLSLGAATVMVSVIFIFLNAYVAFPLYAQVYGMPMETIVGMGNAVNPMITDLPTLMLFSVFPFNLVKHGGTSAAAWLLYKRAGSALRQMLMPAAGIQRG